MGGSQSILGILCVSLGNGLWEVNQLFWGHPVSQWGASAFWLLRQASLFLLPYKEGSRLARWSVWHSPALIICESVVCKDHEEVEKHFKGNLTGEVERKGLKWNLSFFGVSFRSVAQRQQINSLPLVYFSVAPQRQWLEVGLQLDYYQRRAKGL